VLQAQKQEDETLEAERHAGGRRDDGSHAHSNA
jgi:hypothetical protein